MPQIRKLALGCAIAAWLATPGLAAIAAQQNAGAIGQIVPGGGVVTVSSPGGVVVRDIRVHPGDVVKPGDLLMTLDGDALKTERDLADFELQSTKKLAASQIEAQTLAVKLADERLKEASRELASYRALGSQSTSTNEVARLQSQEEQARVALDGERARQQVVNDQADKDIQSATKRLDRARNAMEIHAPSGGTVLKVDKRVGQVLTGDSGIQLADLRTMYVTCQVYEGDLLNLSPGMKATIKSPTLKTPLTGTVEEVGRVIDTRAKLGDVRIKLDRPDPANRLVGMEVEVVIAR